MYKPIFLPKEKKQKQKQRWSYIFSGKYFQLVFVSGYPLSK